MKDTTYYILSGETITQTVTSPFGVTYEAKYLIWSGATSIRAISEREAYKAHKLEYPNRTINGCYFYD